MPMPVFSVTRVGMWLNPHTWTGAEFILFLIVMIFPLLLMTTIFTLTYAILSSIALRRDLLLFLTRTLLSGHWIMLTLTNECLMILTMFVLLRLLQKCFPGFMV